MSLRKPRFVHYQTFSRRTPYAGFTVYLNEGTSPVKYEFVEDPLSVAEEIDPTMASVQIALCSKVDHFCRASGRETAMAGDAVMVPVAQLPLFLAHLEAKCHGYKVDRYSQRDDANAWAWIWKYFL